MRRVALVSVIAVLFLYSSVGYAGFDLMKKVQDKVERKIDREIDESIDRGLDEAEQAVKGEGKEEAAKSPASSAKPPKTKEKAVSASSSGASQQNLKAWSKYDFVPGDEIIFHDDLVDEENGEFPSRWDLHRGNVEIAVYGGENVINFATVQACDIVPLMTQEGDYLPEKFTIEFDAYFSEFCTTYWIRFSDLVNQKPPKSLPLITIRGNDVSVGNFGGTELPRRDYPYWEHVAISFNTRALKIYFGEQRVVNIPNLRAEPIGLTLSSRQCHKGNQALIKNIRIAKGSKKLYDRIMTDGKFVTRGILFDVNKATLKPESMGVINQVAKMMKKHPDLKLCIEGHTDCDGEKGFNQGLSEKRAQAVKDALVDSGIAASRLKTKGHGESRPVADNSTPEGKANNRRVEFVKI